MKAKWHKMTEKEPDEERFLAVLKGQKQIALVEKCDFWGTLAYRTDYGSRVPPEKILYWTHLPELPIKNETSKDNL